MALNYFFRGDIRASVQPVLDEIEMRLSWRPQRDLPLVERIYKLGKALLGLKEIEYLGQPQSGDIKDRLARLIDHILAPLEKEWCGGKREPNVVARVKRLRAAILPDMAAGEVSEEERSRRWRQLADLYLVQQLDFYRPDYVRSRPTPERVLETVERFEEDLTDKARIYRPMTAHIEVGEAIEVSPERDRGAAVDPVMQKLEDSLREMLRRNAERGTKPLELAACPPARTPREGNTMNENPAVPACPRAVAAAGSVPCRASRVDRTGIGAWFLTQSLIGERTPPAAGINDGMHVLLAPWHDFLLDAHRLGQRADDRQFRVH